MSPAKCAHACLKSAPSGCGLPCRSIVCSCFPESGMNSSAARPESASVAVAPLLPKRNADAILAGSLKTLLLLLLLLALVLPLIAILSQALLDHGNWAGSAPWVHLIDNPNFLPMVGRSLGVAAATAPLPLRCWWCRWPICSPMACNVHWRRARVCGAASPCCRCWRHRCCPELR